MFPKHHKLEGRRRAEASSDRAMTFYADIADHDEDDRILIIGQQVMTQNKTVAFIVDDQPGKVDRYIEKLRAKFPGIRLIWRGKGPVAGCEAVKMGPPLN
jgi:hypothetical protein